MTSNRAKAGNVQEYVAARSAIAALPSLPSHIRYLDEYEDEWKTIRHPAECDKWVIEYDTNTSVLDFNKFIDTDVRLFAKHLCTWLLNRSAPAHVALNFHVLLSIANDGGESWFLEGIQRPPYDWNLYWDANVRPFYSQKSANTAKLYLYFLCEMCLGTFRPTHVNFVRSLIFQWNDNYQGVISGESILTADEEARIIEHLDYVTERAAYASDEELAKACLLCISYQHGLRPVQITRLNLNDLRIYPGGDDGPLVHFLAYRAKKRKASDKTAFIRKIKLEWAPLLVEYHRRRCIGQVWIWSETASDAKLFPFARAVIIKAIGDTTEEVTGIRRTATDSLLLYLPEIPSAQ